MSILILMNSAPHHLLFNRIADGLVSEGYRVVYAVDSEAYIEDKQLKNTSFLVESFEDYFKGHIVDQSILKRYSKYNLNYAMLSDYERALTYGVWGDCSEVFNDRLKSALLSFFEELIHKYQIRAVFYENVSNTFAYYCFFVCQELNVKYLGLTSTRLPGRFWFTHDPMCESQILSDKMKEIENGRTTPSQEIQEEVKNYINNIDKIMPDYMKNSPLAEVSIAKKYMKIAKFRKILSRLRYLLKNNRYKFQTGNPLLLSLRYFVRSLSRRITIYATRNMYRKPSDNDKFVLYPLHYHPESSTSILAGTYLNELEVVRNIAFNLPQGYKLYVKDHVSAYGYPSLRFYKEVSTLPNVVLLSPFEDTKELIKQCECVATLTSTVGYEALLLGKIVYLLGTVFYETHPNVVKVNDLSHLYKLLSNCNQRISGDELRAYNERFVTAYYLSSYSGLLNYSPSNLEQLSRQVLDAMTRNLEKST